MRIDPGTTDPAAFQPLDGADGDMCAEHTPEADASTVATALDRSGSAGQVPSLVSSLLQQTLDLALPDPLTAAASPASQLSLLKTAMQTFQALQSNPEAGKALMEQALYEHGELTDAFASFGAALSANPTTALLGGMQSLAAATDDVDLAALERRLGGVLPRQEFSGRTSGQIGRSASTRGRVSGVLGSVSGGTRGHVGLVGQAAGRSSIGISGADMSGSASARFGIDGAIDGHLRSQLLDANVRLAGDVQAYAEASGSATLNKDGLRARGHAEVGVRAQVEVDADFRSAGTTIGGQRLDLNGQVHAQAEASARASVDADVAATINPPRVLANLQAEAFVGVKAGVEGSIGLGDFVTVSGHAEAWAGAGAEAGIIAGYDDGKITFGFNLGAAVEVGAGGGFAIEIDVKALANAAIGLLLGTDGEIDEAAFYDLMAMFPPLQSTMCTSPDTAKQALEDLERALRLAIEDCRRAA